MAGKKRNIDPLWNVLMKEVGLSEPTSFIDHAFLDCTQRECEISKDIVDNYRNVFESRISAGAQESYLVQGNLTQTSLHGLMTWKAIRSNVWSDIANWRTKQRSNCTKSQLHALTSINSEKKIWICWSIVKSMVSNCPEMLVFGTYWKT